MNTKKRQVNKESLVAFLVWAIDEHELICGDYNGDASVTYASDSYETIAERFLSEVAKNTEQANQTAKQS